MSELNKLKDYSELCDIVNNISLLNLGEKHLYNKQDNINIPNKQEYNSELENPYIIHYDENYTDFNKIFECFDLTQYTLEFSNYFTNVINSYFMDIMMKYMHIDNKDKNNINTLLNFYHFCIDYTTSYNNYKDTLDYLQNEHNEYDEKRKDYKKRTKKELHEKLSYNKIIEIRDFMHDLLEDVNFNLSSEDYNDFTKKTYMLLEPMHKLIQYLFKNTNEIIGNPQQFELLKLNDKLDIIIPLLNIIKLILYVLIKNEVL
tara:strand:- start:242 stop:1018 length:777 start_codon:yes stop_codon:yes gene_type:complete